MCQMLSVKENINLENCNKLIPKNCATFITYNLYLNCNYK